MSKKATEEILLEGNFSDILSEKYLAYALSTITSRSLPDVRDGLKPVHRRILWAMHQLKLDPKSGYKKCARVVGDVIGKYHPHGDVAVYDALVRLAQNFSVRYPLVDGQGNFGSVDGDNAAAMRYTEARMTEVATLMLQDIENETVNFKPTYDGLDEEPCILPAYFPNLLANGSEGIAVGMATAIPPHNVDELCDALLHLIKHPNADVKTLVGYVKAPDFPTGGEIIETEESIISSYEKGKGAFRLRSKWEREELGRGGYQIIITEIPYQVQKSRLLEKLAESLENKKIPLVGNIKDESAENIRIIIEPKNRTIDAEILMESLFRSSDLEIRYNMNLNALDANGLPRVMSLKDILLAFLDHRKEVLIRKSQNRLNKINARLEILAGFLIAYLNLDEIIRIIREEDEPKQVMMKKFKLTDNQAEAILNMRLRSLRKLEEIEIKSENKALKEEKSRLEEILKNPDEQKKEIANNIKEIKKLFSNKTELGKRRTQVTHKLLANNVISIEAFVEKEPVTIVLSKLNWIRSFKGHNLDTSSVKYKEGDEEGLIIKAQTTDKIMFFSSFGKSFTLNADKIPGGKGFGDPLSLLLDIAPEEEIIAKFAYDETAKYILASKTGKGFVVEAPDLIASTKSGKQIMNLKEKDKVIICKKITANHIATIGENRKIIIFPLEQIPAMKRGQGVGLQKFKDGGLSDLTFVDLSVGLEYYKGERRFVVENFKYWLANRADAGKLAPEGFPRNNKF
ncbi:MAG: DNA topoisomerase IV subunit A [Rickettsiales bacterium]|nr:DNA topoisomerase IV subunit A [Rickettsiales bacterium]